MNFEKLLSEKKIEKVEKRDFNLNFTEKDLKFAKNGLDTQNNDWAMTIAYEVILKTASRLMNFLGYRAIGKEHHKNTFEFLKEIDIDKDLVDYFDNIRKKRNDFIYRDIENTSKEEVQEVIEKAEGFVQKIIDFVEVKNKNNKDK